MIPLQNHEYREIHRISQQNYENQKNKNITYQNHENHEILKIPPEYRKSLKN